MAKRRKKRKSTGRPTTKRCKMVKVDTSGKSDRVKIGSRTFKLCKGRAMDVHKNGKTWVCPVGRKWKLSTTTGTLDALCKAPKR